MESKLNIDFNYYKTFYYVATCNSFSSAAKEMGISQPAVSYNISELEKSIGDELFIRKGKRIELTKIGKDLFEYVNDCFNTLSLIESKILNKNLEAKSQFFIGIQSYLARILSSLHEFLNFNPNVYAKFIDDSAENLIKKVEQKEIDFAIVAGKFLTKLSSIKLTDLHMVFAIKSNENIILNANTAGKYEFAFPSKTTKARKEIDRILLDNEINLTPKYEFNSNEICLTLMKSLNSVFYVPKEVISNEIEKGEYKIIKTRFELPSVPIFIYYNERYIDSSVSNLINILLNSTLTNEGH